MILSDYIKLFSYIRYRDSPNLRDKEPTILAMARAYCFYGTDVIQTQQWNDAFWGGLPRTDVPTCGEVRHRGGVRGIRDRIRRGGLGTEESLRPWTGGYFRGLIFSGALRGIHSPSIWGRYQIWEHSHQALVKDLEQASIGMNFEKHPGASGCRRLSRCPAISLPGLDEDATAGIFSGSLLEADSAGETWLVLPASDAIKSLLSRMTIGFQPWRTFRNQERVAVSPFYAQLFTPRMPHESAKRIRAIKSPAQGEILPLLYWATYMEREGQRIPPFANSLPYAISPRTYRRRKYGRSELHKKAVLEFKILSLAPPLRLAMTAWFQSKFSTLCKAVTPQADCGSISA